jgi:hypothetical protein
MSLEQDREIQEKVYKLWERVFEASNKIVAQAQNYGFNSIEIIPNPNIHQILHLLRGFSGLITGLIDDELGPDQIRQLINAREQLIRMERVALALVNDDQVEFERAVAELESQAPF